MAEQLFEIQTDKIENGARLMYNNTALTSWTGDLTRLIDASYMFSKCSNLTKWDVELPSLSIGQYMFDNCYNLTAWDIELPSLTNGYSMFYNCTNLTSFSSDLSSLTNGSWMFYRSGLESFNSVLPSLTNGIGMFSNCYNFKSFNSVLPSLTYGDAMFSVCHNLKTFSSDLSSLIEGANMFCKCTSLTTFSSDLSSLTNGCDMFRQCINLTSFSSDLSSLTDGYMMFDGCKLDAPSVKNIALTINKNADIPTIDLGIDATITSDAQVKKDIGLIVHKGWDLWINGGFTHGDYTLPKYARCTTIAKITAKDGNFLTNDIVNGVWGEHLPDLEDSNPEYERETGMFYSCSKLTSFSGDLSSLTNGYSMFYNCTNLTSFSSNLSSLEYGSGMFQGCGNLESFNCNNLSSLTQGDGMFYGCTNLTSFNSDLTSLTYAYSMFYNCTNLTSFNSDLSSLTNGESMFSNCHLDAQSVANIVHTLPTHESGGQIAIGIGCDKTEADFLLFAQECNCDSWHELSYNFSAKNWQVYFELNGRPTTTYNMRRGETLPIYAKLEEVTDEKHAHYTSADGSKFYNIRHFHYTNGSTEGYDVFSSLEEAISTYKVTPKN